MGLCNDLGELRALPFRDGTVAADVCHCSRGRGEKILTDNAEQPGLCFRVEAAPKFFQGLFFHIECFISCLKIREESRLVHSRGRVALPVPLAALTGGTAHCAW